MVGSWLREHKKDVVRHVHALADAAKVVKNENKQKGSSNDPASHKIRSLRYI